MKQRDLEGSIVTIKDGIKGITLKGGSFMSMDELWDITQKEGTCIYNMSTDELTYFNLLPQEEQDEYMKVHVGHDENRGYIIFTG